MYVVWNRLFVLLLKGRLRYLAKLKVIVSGEYYKAYKAIERADLYYYLREIERSIENTKELLILYKRKLR